MSKENMEKITKQDLLTDIQQVSTLSVPVGDLYKLRGVVRSEYRQALANFDLVDTFDDTMNQARIQAMTIARKTQEAKEEERKKLRDKGKVPLLGPTTLVEAAKVSGPQGEGEGEDRKGKKKTVPKPEPKKPTEKKWFGLDSSTLMWIGLGALAFLLFSQYKQGKLSLPFTQPGPPVTGPETGDRMSLEDKLKAKWGDMV